MRLRGLPLYFQPRDSEVLVVGGGSAARIKVEGLNQGGLSPVLVSPILKGDWSGASLSRTEERIFAPEDLESKRLVYACTDDLDLNRAIAEDCRKRNILCSPAGLAGEGDFYSMAQWEWGNFVLALSSGGGRRKAMLQLKEKLKAFLEEQNEI